MKNRKGYTLIEFLVIMSIILIFMLFVVICAGAMVPSWFLQDSVRVTVTKTERVHKDDKYLVYSEDETFENTDTVAFLKFNSSDIYGKIEPGETYTFHVAGIRWPFMSWYRNIIDIEEHHQEEVSDESE